MKKCGIAIDPWKLPIFERLLTSHGFKFKNAGKLSEGVLLLSVETENVGALHQMVADFNAEAARTGAPK